MPEENKKFLDEMHTEENENGVEEATENTNESKLKSKLSQIRGFKIFYFVLSAILAINVIVVMLATVNYLPEFGFAGNPAVNEVFVRYIEQGTYETGALNIVASVLYGYRSFDTLGEAIVLFAAAIAVIMLLREGRTN